MGKTSAFRGKTRELEKRTKVKARVIAYAMRELIDQSDRVIIMGMKTAISIRWALRSTSGRRK